MSNIHTCFVCGKSAPWSDNWLWYGSYRQIDDGNDVVKLCSPTCRTEFSKRRKIASSIRMQARQKAALARYGR